MLSTLQRIILENHQLLRERELIARDLAIPQTRQIKVFSGPRRCGKTCLMQIEARKYGIENILYLDFEDERLLDLRSLNNYDLVLDAYHSLFPGSKPVICFDEIQALESWHLFVKRLYEKYPDIYLTGSNANLMSSDIATYLTGRALILKARPFSFSEFLHIKGWKPSQRDLVQKPAFWLGLFNEYRVWGGFPEVILSADKYPILQSIYQLILLKDLAVRHNYSEYALRLIMSKLSENIGKSFSLNSLYLKIKQHYPFSRTNFYDYVQSLEQPYLTQPIFLWRKSFVMRESERKTYFIDNGFIKLLTVTDDYGKLLENCVFLELSRRYDELYYYRTHSKQEVDFLVRDRAELQLIQVSETISNPETYSRETTALFNAMQELDINKSLLITAYEEQIIRRDDMSISVVPVWKWCLEKS